MKAKSIKGHSTAEIATALKSSLADGYKPTVAIVFMSIKQDIAGVSDLLDAEGIDVFGATTAGEFIDGDVLEESIAIMLLDMNRDYYHLRFEETGDSHTVDISRSIGEDGRAAFSQPAFIVASGGIATDGEMIVRGIEQGAGDNVSIFGGLAGDDFTMTGTYVFTNGKKTNNGIVVLIVDESKISVRGLATSGWKPVGTVRTVTRSAGNVVYTIDDQPALDIVIKYMGIDNNIDEWKDVIMNVGSENPMQLLRDDAPPVIRAPLFANKEDRSLVCAGSVPQGSKVRFSLPPDFDVIDTVAAECREVKGDDTTDADAMIMFSCKARHLSLGPLVGEEISQVKDIWGSPMVGFFSYGEIGKALRAKHDFHNNTCSFVALKEL